MRLKIIGFLLALAIPGAASAAGAVSADLIRLHDDLRLSDTQEGAWREYTRLIARDPQAQARHRSAQDLMPLIPTPRRIALIEATMAQDAADFHRQGQGVIAFYNQLTPQQQKTFDIDSAPQSTPGGDRR